jgi:cytidine deaminase
MAHGNDAPAFAALRDRTMPAPLDELLEAARAASRAAYCPYSQFHVGAAVLAGGRIFTGANVENASYGLTICAERTAAFAAVLAGAVAIEAVAVACVDAPAGCDPTGLMPCGACRQVLAEFAAGDTPVVVDRAGTFTLAELLPMAFRLR